MKDRILDWYHASPFLDDLSLLLIYMVLWILLLVVPAGIYEFWRDRR